MEETQPLATEGLHCVITGDLVASTMVKAEAIHAMFIDLATTLKDRLTAVGGDYIFQFRGDGFQMLCNDLGSGVTTMLLVKAWLTWHSHEYAEGKHLETRLFLGVGPMVTGKTLGSSSGEAFVLSGRGLDKLSPPSTMGIAIAGRENRGLIHVVNLLDEISSRWKPAQCETMFYLLHGMNYTDIAETTGRSKSTISQAGRSLGWPRLKSTIAYIEQELASYQ